MFGRLKKSKTPAKKTAQAKDKKMSTQKHSHEKEEKSAFHRILTAEGWRRMMMKNKKKKR
jgi:hypothetical protein